MFTTGFTIAICDDDPLYLEHSEQIISEFLLTQTEIEKYTILTFSSGEEYNYNRYSLFRYRDAWNVRYCN